MPIAFTGSMWITGSLYINGVQANPVSRSYAVTASHNSNAIASASNGLIKTGSSVELGGFVYRNTFVTGTLAGSGDFSFLPTGSTSFTSGSNNAAASPSGIIQDSQGRKYFFGNFDKYNYTSSQGLVRINSDGSRDSSFNVGIGFFTGSSVTFTGVAYPDAIKLYSSGGVDKIYVGGFFSQYSGSSANCIVRLNTDGTIDQTFNYGTGFSGRHQSNIGTSVYNIDFDSYGRILVGGNFDQYSGSSTLPALCRLNTDGTLDTSFNSGLGITTGSLPGSKTAVLKLKVEPTTNKVYISGYFTNYSGSSGFSGFIKINENGTIDNTFVASPGLSAPAGYSTPGWIGTFSGGIITDKNLNVYLIGSFISWNGTTARGIIKMNSSGSVDTSFNYGTGIKSTAATDYTGLNSSPYLDDYNRLYLFGRIASYSGSAGSGSVRILPNGTKDPEFNSGSIPGPLLYNYSTTVLGSAQIYPLLPSLDKKSLYVIGNHNWYKGTIINPGILKVDISDPELAFKKTQVSYAADYSQFFVSRSVVDKGYLDNLLSGSVRTTGSVYQTGSSSALYLTLPVMDPLPSVNIPTGSVLSSGSGVDNKPYYWNGSSWNSLI